MKKKILSLLLAICMFVPLSFSLVACSNGDDSDTAEKTSSTGTQTSVTLEYETTVYDGTAKEPTVTVTKGNSTVSNDNYTVEYSNNTNAGTATVVVSAESGSTVLAPNYSVTKTFEITKAPIEVGTLDALNTAINNGTDANHVIKLTADINSTVEICPSTKDLDVAIDLNGHNINSELYVISTTGNTNTLKLSLTNSSNEESIIGSESSNVWYGLIFKTNNNYDIDVENITFKGYWAGIHSNGSFSSDTTFDARNCKFVGTKNPGVNSGDVSIGTYLASGNIVYTYNSCEFEGYGGYYAKSGTHNFVNCTVKATGTTAFAPLYNGSGCEVTGSALMIDSCAGAGYTKSLTVNISGGQFISACKNAIESFSTYKAGQTKLVYSAINFDSNLPVLTSAEGYDNISIEGPNA